VNPQLQAAIGICIATLGGLAVGLEREWSGHASGPHARFAGIRTFTLLGLLGGVSGWMWSMGQQLLPGLLVAGAVGLTVAAYSVASRHDIEGTTEVAALVVLAAALAAGMHRWVPAAAIFAFTTFLLVEKSGIHGMVRRLDDASLRAAARFAVMAVVILPILPGGPYGPWGGFEPRMLWIVVLFFSGLNFAGYIARRAAGETRGDLMTGVLGGFVSSTAVTMTNAQRSNSEKNSTPLVSGALAACTVVYLRVLLATAVLNPSLAGALALYLAVPVSVGAVATLICVRQTHAGPARLEAPENPLQLYSALKMALLFQAVLYAVYGLQLLFRETGTLASGAVVGLIELDALIVAMARTASNAGTDAAIPALLAGLVADATLKLALAVFVGKGRFRWSMAAGLGIIGAALAGSLIVAYRQIA
jgi:uncharacterized membrane protein (DUF4010 family)